MELEHVRNLGDSSFNSSFLDEEKKPREWNDPIFEKKKRVVILSVIQLSSLKSANNQMADSPRTAS